MEPSETKYFANPESDGKFNPNYFFHWADANNESINDWERICDTLVLSPFWEVHKLTIGVCFEPFMHKKKFDYILDVQAPVTIGEKLREIRCKRIISARDVAAIIDVNWKTFIRYENGESDILTYKGYRYAKAFCKAMDIPIEEIGSDYLALSNGELVDMLTSYIWENGWSNHEAAYFLGYNHKTLRILYTQRTNEFLMPYGLESQEIKGLLHNSR